MTQIPSAERLIVALDVPNAAEAHALVERLGDAVRFYKVGLELFSVPGCFELVAWLTGRGHKVFADLKLHDIPETVRRAVANLRGSGATFLTVHGHRSVMEAAAREKGAMKILAVTVLTSLDGSEYPEVYASADVAARVLTFARAAEANGMDGVVCSPKELSILGGAVGSGFLRVTPGIRFQGGDAQDQARVATPASAFRDGATHLVVGRAVTAASDPRAALEAARAERDAAAAPARR